MKNGASAPQLAARLVLWVNHPLTLLTSALVLFVSSLYEALASAEELALGAHHGVMLYSLLQMARVLPEWVEGAKQVQHAFEVKPSQPPPA